MRGAFVVYSIAALVFAAGTGPAFQAVKDGTLDDLAGLKKPRPLQDYPFIEAFRTYLPPVVVDWILVDPSEKVNVPPGAHVRFDAEGRLIIVWPDGCSEEVKDPKAPRRETCQEPTPPPPRPPPCPGDPDYDNATIPPDTCPDPDIRCASGYHVEWDTSIGEYVCRLDDACQTEDAAARPDHCPAPPPPELVCSEHEVMTDDGRECLPRTEHAVMTQYRVSSETTVELPVSLKTTYRELRIRFTVAGQPAPGYTIAVERVSDGQPVCFVRDGSRVCQFSGNLFGENEVSAATAADDAPFPAAAYRMRVVYDDPAVDSGDRLTIDLFGTPQG